MSNLDKELEIGLKPSKTFVKKSIREYIWIGAGTLFAAVGIDFFLVPFKIAPGGWSGLAEVIYYLSGQRIPVGMTMLALNIPLFIIGIRSIGRAFVYRTLFATFGISIFIDLLQPAAHFVVLKLQNSTADSRLFGDLMLYSVIGGAVMGAGLGIVFRFGATTGGSDLAARIFNRFLPNLTVGRVLFIIDAIVVVIASVAFNSFALGLYALITIFINSKAVDIFLEGINFARAILIITQKPQEIADKIMSEIGRGVTGLHGIGMFTGSEKNVLLCVLQRAEVPLLKDVVRLNDKNAFIILVDIREVLGEGFINYTG